MGVAGMRTNRWLSLALVLALAAPGFAADAKKADKKADDKKAADKKAADKDEAKPKIEKVPLWQSFVGKLNSMDVNSQRDFTVQISQSVVEPNYGVIQSLLQRQAQLGQQLQNAMRVANPVQRQQQLKQVYRQMNTHSNQNLYTVKLVTKDIDLRGSDEVKVRLLNPPVDYDEKGRPKKYTAKELKEMKGPEGYPGYTANWEDLKQNQVVRVYLVKNKELPKMAAGKKKKDKDEDPEILEAARPEVVMIVILAEPPTAP